MKKSFGKGVLFMLLSAFFLSLGLLFVKFSSADFPFFWLVFARYLIGTLFLSIILLFRKRLLLTLRTKNFRFHLLRAIVITASQYCLIYYLTKSSLLHATVLRNTAPLFIPIIGRLFLHQRLGKSTMISLAISAVGLLLLLRPGGSLFEWVSLFGLATGILWAISQTIYGLTVRRENVETSIFYAFFLGALIAFPALFIFPVSFDQLPMGAFHIQGIALLLSLGVCALLNQFFRGKAYSFGKPTTLAIFLYSSVVISGLFDWVFFRVIPDLMTIIGSSLIILGGVAKIYLRYLFLKRR